MSKMFQRNVFITGAASGLGFELAKQALQQGASVYFVDRVAAHVDAAERALREFGKCHGFVGDVTDVEAMQGIVEKIILQGGIDILINNAGIVVGKGFNEHTMVDIDRTMAINTVAPMQLAHMVLPQMVRDGNGIICNIASSAGLISNPNMSVYAASKWALIGWSDSLRIEMQRNKTGVQVTTIAPYYINTGMFDGVKSIIPILKTERAATRIWKAIHRKKSIYAMPWSLNLVRFAQGLLPQAWFDFLIGRVMGVHSSMDQFKGRS